MLMFALVDMLKQDVEARGARLTVAIVPSISQVYTELWTGFLAARPAGGSSPPHPASASQAPHTANAAIAPAGGSLRVASLIRRRPF